MTIRAIIFDFGKVIGFFDHWLITNRLAKHSPLSPEVIHATLFGSPLEHDYDSGRITTEEFLARARRLCQLDCPDEEIIDAWCDIFTPNEALIALLPRLRTRYRLLVGSNTNELHTCHFTKQFSAAFRHLHHLVFSHDVRARKPEAAFFEHCVRRAECPARECVFIDDLPANVAGAEACGLHGIVYQGMDDLRARLAALGVTTTTT